MYIRASVDVRAYREGAVSLSRVKYVVPQISYRSTVPYLLSGLKKLVDKVKL